MNYSWAPEYRISRLMLEGNYGEAGKRGAGILVGRNCEGRAEFTLQFRAVEKGYEKSVISENLVSLVLDVGMRYCPWCGRDLERWYDAVADALYRSDLKITY